MGISRTSEFLLRGTEAAALEAFARSLEKLDMAVERVSSTSLRASAARSIRKNRWAAEIAVEVSSCADGAQARVTVDMLGTKHFDVLMEITDNLAELIDDRGVGSAAERLGKAGRFFGTLELRMLPTLLQGRERVLGLASGNYDKHVCMMCLTSERVLLVDKGLFATNLNVSDIPLKSVVAVSTKRGLTGEKLEISTSGANLVIESVMPGQAETMARLIREAQQAVQSAPSAPVVQVAESSLDALKKLAELHAAGIVTDEEFAQKKAQLLERL